ncbi:MAG: hypothetical protein IKN56_07925 [Clostridia bacterium]|nr:hypothetical protein [Clostridia bacterium]
MVKGLDKFKEFFENYGNNYVLIGGTACSIIFDEIGLDFRATKDLDVVLIIENLNDEFANKIWEFIKAAGYQIEEGKNKKFYRFNNPKDRSFPQMIELFSRNNSINLVPNAHLEPIHISDDVSSLSAILLNDDYYNLLLEGKRTVLGYSVLDEKYLIPFKAKAWCEMTDRHENGEEGLSKHIKKHFRDIYRLSRIVVQTDKVSLDGIVYDDMERFINSILTTENKSDDINYQEMFELLSSMYL